MHSSKPEGLVQSRMILPQIALPHCLVLDVFCIDTSCVDAVLSDEDIHHHQQPDHINLVFSRKTRTYLGEFEAHVARKSLRQQSQLVYARSELLRDTHHSRRAIAFIRAVLLLCSQICFLMLH